MADPPQVRVGAEEAARSVPRPRVRASWARSRRYGVAPEWVQPVFSGALPTDSLFYECGAEVLGRTAGTNGLGLALADRVPARVRAEEHYVAPLRRYTCAAVPVLDPRSGLAQYGLRVPGREHGAP